MALKVPGCAFLYIVVAKTNLGYDRNVGHAAIGTVARCPARDQRHSGQRLGHGARRR